MRNFRIKSFLRYMTFFAFGQITAIILFRKFMDYQEKKLRPLRGINNLLEKG